MLILAWDNRLDDATIYETAETVPALPRSNLQDRNLQAIWRTTTLANQRASFQFATNQPAQLVALLNHNLRNGVVDPLTIDVWSSYDPATQIGVAVATSTPLIPWVPEGMLNHAFAYLGDASGTYPWVTFELDDATHTVLQAGRAWAGPCWSLSNHRWRPAFDDTGRMGRTKLAYGQLGLGARFRALSLDITVKTDAAVWGDPADANAEHFLDAISAMQIGQEVIALPRQDDTQATSHDGFLTQRTGLFGSLESRATIRHQGDQVWLVSLTIVETR